MNRSRMILKCFHSRDRVLLTKAFCTYVRPILEYCSPILNTLLLKLSMFRDILQKD